MKFDGIKRGIEIFSDACQTTDTMKIAMVLSIIRDLICVIENEPAKSDEKAMGQHLDDIYTRLENIEGYLFNPFKQSGLTKHLERLEQRLPPLYTPIDDSKQDKGTTVYYPVYFDVALVAFRQGKTIKHRSWDKGINLSNFEDESRGGNLAIRVKDMVYESWIILD
jgi:hypothetical protein